MPAGAGGAGGSGGGLHHLAATQHGDGPQLRVGDDDVARLTEGGAIAGGTAHLIDVVRTTWQGGVDLVDAVYAASVQGAQILGDPTVGALRAGLWADVVVTDAELRPVTVLRRGEAVEPAA